MNKIWKLVLTFLLIITQLPNAQTYYIIEHYYESTLSAPYLKPIIDYPDNEKIKLKWTINLDEVAPEEFEVQYGLDGCYNKSKVTRNIYTYLYYDNFVPGKRYNFCVRGILEGNKSRWSNIRYFDVPVVSIISPPKPPNWININIYDNQIKVNWDSVDVADYYVVNEYWDGAYAGKRSTKEIYELYAIRNCVFQQKYEVKAVNSAGSSNWSDHVIYSNDINEDIENNSVEVNDENSSSSDNNVYYVDFNHLEDEQDLAKIHLYGWSLTELFDANGGLADALADALKKNKILDNLVFAHDEAFPNYNSITKAYIFLSDKYGISASIRIGYDGKNYIPQYIIESKSQNLRFHITAGGKNFHVESLSGNHIGLSGHIYLTQSYDNILNIVSRSQQKTGFIKIDSSGRLYSYFTDLDLSNPSTRKLFTNSPEKIDTNFNIRIFEKPENFNYDSLDNLKKGTDDFLRSFKTKKISQPRYTKMGKALKYLRTGGKILEVADTIYTCYDIALALYHLNWEGAICKTSAYITTYLAMEGWAGVSTAVCTPLTVAGGIPGIVCAGGAAVLGIALAVYTYNKAEEICFNALEINAGNGTIVTLSKEIIEDISHELDRMKTLGDYDDIFENIDNKGKYYIEYNGDSELEVTVLPQDNDTMSDDNLEFISNPIEIKSKSSAQSLSNKLYLEINFDKSGIEEHSEIKIFKAENKFNWIAAENTYIDIPRDKAIIEVNKCPTVFVVGVNINSNIDDSFTFKDVYAFPNPAKECNPTIHVECGIADEVEIKIYNIAGELINSTILSDTPEVINGKYAYEYTWDTTSVPSGVYLYMAKASKEGKKEIKATNKLALIK